MTAQILLIILLHFQSTYLGLGKVWSVQFLYLVVAAFWSQATSHWDMPSPHHCDSASRCSRFWTLWMFRCVPSKIRSIYLNRCSSFRSLVEGSTQTLARFWLTENRNRKYTSLWSIRPWIMIIFDRPKWMTLTRIPVFNWVMPVTKISRLSALLYKITKSSWKSW